MIGVRESSHATVRASLLPATVLPVQEGGAVPEVSQPEMSTLGVKVASAQVGEGEPQARVRSVAKNPT